MVCKPSWFEVEWWTDIEDVRVPALAEMRDTKFGPVRWKGWSQEIGGGGHALMRTYVQELQTGAITYARKVPRVLMSIMRSYLNDIGVSEGEQRKEGFIVRERRNRRNQKEGGKRGGYTQETKEVEGHTREKGGIEGNKRFIREKGGGKGYTQEKKEEEGHTREGG